jgi:hypothetical protein
MKITGIGIVVFLVIVVAFFAWFGGPPTLPDDSYMTRGGIGRSWLYCSLLFIAGAGTACFGDKEYGMFPPASLRWLFIVLGAFIMVVSTAWMHSLTETWARGSSAFLLPTPQNHALQRTAMGRHGRAAWAVAAPFPPVAELLSFGGKYAVASGSKWAGLYTRSFSVDAASA